jgi:peptide/nickel transport system ATP-binding protein
MSSQPLLEVDGLTTEFTTQDGALTALDGVDFEIRRGEIMGIVGESGAGKSVTARSIMRLIDSPGRITEGSIRLDGEELFDKGERELQQIRGNRIAMIFQDPLSSLNPVFKVGSQITEAITLHQDASEKEAWEQAVDMLEQVGIPDAATRAEDYPHEFSGGMRQRAMIAMALSCEPDLLIADEPTTALDVTIEAQILDLLEEISAEFDTSVMFITHDLGVIARLCDRVTVMYAGDAVEIAAIDELFENPRHPYTQGLLASIPRITDPRDTELTTIEGTMPSLDDKPAGCRFHPRCPYATDECAEAYPKMEDISEGANHEARCIHWNDIPDEWADEEIRALDRSTTDAGDTLVDVERLRKWFVANDGLLDRISIDRERGISLAPDYVKAVDGVDFEIRAGETLGLVGESGCGKSTTAKSLLRLLEPSDGDVWFRSSGGERRNVTELGKTDLRSIRREIQMIFQDPQSSLNPRKTVAEIIGRPMELHDIATGTEKRDRIDELLDQVGLDPAAKGRYPHEFSGGQQQRIGIARALAVDPKCLIADEPVSALDVSVQAKIINLLMRLQDEMGLSILFIAHDLRVVRHISDRVAVMYLGNVMEIGAVEDVFHPPYHPYTAALLSSIPVADPATDPDRITLEGDVPTPLDPPSGCPFHTRCPEYVAGECDADPIPMAEIDDDHRVACILDRTDLPARDFLEVHADTQTDTAADD